MSLNNIISVLLPETVSDEKCDLINTDDYVDVFGVRISPPSMEFENAFEGRSYERRFAIKNVGKNKVFVRITPPNSYSCKMKGVKGRFLSPGLQLVKRVRFVFSHVNFQFCTIGIYVDDNLFKYHVSAKAAAALVTISPKSIDFGAIDANYASKLKAIVLTNDGNKMTRFFVDYSKGKEHKLIIDPNKGFLPPRSSKTISVRIISSVVGTLNLEVWIKCEEPLVVPITATVIHPKLLPLNVCATSTFALVDFPVTYVGLKSVQTVFVRNECESAAMFCFVGEFKGIVHSLVHCRRYPEFKCFDVYPRDGIAESKEVKVLHFKFEPKFGKTEALAPFYFCCYQMNRIRCKYLEANEYEGQLFADYGSFLPIVSGSFLLERSQDSLMVLRQSSSDDGNYNLASQDGEYLKFYLHAVAVRPSVLIIPDELILNGLEIGKRETRVFELRNSSIHLPIIASYRKVPFVDVEPKSVLIKSASSVDVSVFITPQHLNSCDTEVRFDLMYYDHPREDSKPKVIGKVTAKLHFDVKCVTKVPLPQINKALGPNYIKDVGKHCHNITFNDLVEMPKVTVAGVKLFKRCSGLIALPNDRPGSLRPWRSNMRCKTIFTKYPRYEPPLDTDHEMTVLEKQLRKDTDEYYVTYLRREAEKRKAIVAKKQPKTMEDYDVTEVTKVMSGDVKLPDPVTLKMQHISRKQCFIALTPTQMNNVVIYPMIINTGPIASHDRYHFTINIRNANTFPILVYMKSDLSVLFPEGEKKVIKGTTEFKVLATYISHSVGYYTCNVDVIINECIVFVVTIIADVCSRYLQLDKECVNFIDENTIEFIEITNSLNAKISFSWRLVSGNFEIEPTEGSVKPYSTTLCQVQYFPEKDGARETDVDFFSADKYSHQVRLSILSEKVKLQFVPNEIIFEDIPLNMPATRHVTLVNKQNGFQAFSVGLNDDELCQYLKVRPSKGIITGKSQVIISVVLTLPICAKFCGNINFDVPGFSTLTLPVKGNVIYPNIIVSPTVVHFKKIPASSRAFLPFTITNKCCTPSTIKFDLRNYKEYTIHESNRWWEEPPIDFLNLPAGAIKSVYLHFSPSHAFRDMFFLPMIINDILGPVQDEITSINVFPDAGPQDLWYQPIEVPKTLPCVKILDYAMTPKLHFSKLHVDLHYSLIASKVETRYRLRISNVQRNEDYICMRTDYLADPLHIEVLPDREVIFYTSSIVCTLAPNEEVAFLISFQPETYGLYKGRLPIFLKSDRSRKPHNIITITADFPAPTIRSVTPAIYLKPLPLGVTVTCTNLFYLRGHGEECTITSEANSEDAIIELNDTKLLQNEILITWNIETKYRTELNVLCKISCSCNAECQISLLGCVENCLLTTYAFIGANGYRYYEEIRNELVAEISSRTASPIEMNNHIQRDNSYYDLDEFFCEYPSYSASDNNILEFMDSCVVAMESWMYTQGFFGSAFHRIPADISFVTFEQSKSKSWTPNMPYMKLLLNLTGQTVEKRFKLTLKSNDRFDKALYCYAFYKDAMQFLADLGAFLPNLLPEYLLDYPLYRLYTEHECNNANQQNKFATQLLAVEEFENVSKQCWLDIILQTYKVLVLSAITRSQDSEPVTSGKCLPHILFRESLKIQKETTVYSPAEVMLLQWLQYHFEAIRIQHWSKNQHVYPKELVFFDENMDDGFVFAAVTLSYCPYLKEHFKKLYLQPHSLEENLHNSIIVVQSWKMLNFSIDVRAQRLIFSHPVANLILTTYLYEVLPDMYPRETIDFSAGLSKTCTRGVEIKNQNPFPVAYKAAFIGDEFEDAFSIRESFYVIQPMGKCNILVTYTARYVKEYVCALVLNGECKGYRYARNKVVTLVGRPDVRHVVNTISFSLSLYVCKEVKLEVKSPYQGVTRYQIQFSIKECSKIAEIEELPCNRDIKPLTIYRFIPLDSEVDCNNKGEFQLSGLCATLFHTTVPTWIYFSSSELGAFCIEIVIATSLVPMLQEVVEVALPKSEGAVTPKRREPQKVVYINIPRKNKLMRKTIMETLFRTWRNETEFLKSIVTTVTGMHILEKLVVICTQTMPYSLCKSMEYTVTMHKRADIKLPKTILLEDICYAKDVAIPFYYRPSASVPGHIIFSLRSNETAEVRFYKVIFLREEEPLLSSPFAYDRLDKVS